MGTLANSEDLDEIQHISSERILFANLYNLLAQKNNTQPEFDPLKCIMEHSN